MTCFLRCCITETGDSLVVLWRDLIFVLSLKLFQIALHTYAHRQKGSACLLHNLISLPGPQQWPDFDFEAGRDLTFTVALQFEDVVVNASHPLVQAPLMFPY